MQELNEKVMALEKDKQELAGQLSQKDQAIQQLQSKLPPVQPGVSLELVDKIKVLEALMEKQQYNFEILRSESQQ